MGCCCVTSVYDRDPNTYGNFNTAVFTATAAAPEITFRVQRAGQGNIRIFFRADADAAGERAEADVEIRRDGPSGTVVHTPVASDGGVAWEWDPGLGSNQNLYGDRPLEPIGLAPGTYWAQLQVNTHGTNIDIDDQWIRFGA